MGFPANGRWIGAIGLTAAKPALVLPLRDRLTSALSGLLAFLAVALPVVVLVALMSVSAAIAWEMIEWWRLMPVSSWASVDWTPAR